VVAASTIYGGTYTLLSRTLPRFGVNTTFVDPEASIAELRKAFRPETRALLAETIGNPGLGILDFAKFAALAREFDVPFIVDNTLATPYLCNPFRLGANIVTHSATKYIDGHATSIGGVVIDGGNYNWANDKYPDLTEADETYAGTRYVEKFQRAAYAAKARAQYLRDFGACLSPFNAFLFNVGLETLHLRIERHSANALALARFLQKHPQVDWVTYPGLSGNLNRARIRRYFLHSAASL
jgi:O-acetylhomoserine (thiol)-lyase